jgi:hypothetical protein
MKRWIGVAIALSLGSFLAVEGLPSFGGKGGKKAAVASLQPTPIERIWEGIANARQLAAANRQQDAIAQLDEVFAAARSLENREERNPLLAKIIAEYGAVGAYEEAIAQLSTLSYDEPLPDGDSSLRMQGEVSITAAFVRANALERALEFARGIAFEPSKNRALVEVIAGYVMHRQLEKAAAIAPTLQNDTYQYYRAVNALIEAYSQSGKYTEGLAFIDTVAGENKDSAARSFAEAAWRSGRFNIALQSVQKIGNPSSKIQALRDLSKTLVSVGQLEQAAPITLQAFELSQQTDEFQPFDWVEDFLITGQEERAQTIISTLKGSENETAYSRASIANAYLKIGRYREAFEFAKTIPDRVLLPLPEYRDPKVEIFEAIIDRALTDNNFDFAVQVALSLTEKPDRVAALRTIAHQQSNPEQTLNVLNRALDITKTIESISIVPERSLSWLEPNSGILLNLAEDYQKLGNKAKVLETLELATQSSLKFETQYAFEQPVWTKSSVLSRIASMYLELGEPEKAAEIAGIATTQIQEIEQFHRKIQEQMSMAEFYLKLNKNSEAISLLETVEQQNQLIERPVEQLSFLLRTANLWVKVNREENAMQLLNRVLIESEKLEAKNDKISVWIGAIAAYGRMGENNLVRDLTNKTLQAIETLQPDYEKARLLEALGRTVAISNFNQLALDIVQQVSNPAAQARILFATTTEYAQQENPALASATLTQALATAKNIKDEVLREQILSEMARNLAIFQFEVSHLQPKDTWRTALSLQVAESITNPELRGKTLLEIAFKYLLVNDKDATKRALNAAFNGVRGGENQQQWLSTVLETFNSALTAREFDFGHQIAQNIESADARIIAMRQVAQQIAIAEKLEQARTILAETIEIANSLEDATYRQQVLADLKQQQSAIDQLSNQHFLTAP